VHRGYLAGGLHQGYTNSGLIGLFLGPPISILLITTLLEIYLETYRQPDLAPSDV
jgi:predicted PurR-regulated permease PerM